MSQLIIWICPLRIILVLDCFRIAISIDTLFTCVRLCAITFLFPKRFPFSNTGMQIHRYSSKIADTLSISLVYKRQHIVTLRFKCNAEQSHHYRPVCLPVTRTFLRNRYIRGYEICILYFPKQVLILTSTIKWGGAVNWKWLPISKDHFSISSETKLIIIHYYHCY